jgi:maleate cis-trans isomerase
MSGTQQKLGLVVPSLNSVMESEIQRMADGAMSLHTMRVSAHWNGTSATVGTKENLLWMDSQVPEAAKLLAHAAVDVICYGCTGGGVIGGPGADEKLCAAIEKATGVPATVTIRSVAAALRALGARTISVASPYEAWLNESLRSFLESSGFEVAAIQGFAVATNRKITFEEAARISAEDVAQLAIGVDRPESDAIFISCTNFPTLEVVQSLERKLGKPVITSTTASMWEMLRMLGDARDIPPAGRLFAQPHVTA